MDGRKRIMRKGCDGAHKRRVKERQSDRGTMAKGMEWRRKDRWKACESGGFYERGWKEEDYEEGIRLCT